MFYFGAHLRKDPNIIAALQEIQKYGGNCLQIFISNPMTSQHKKKLFKKYEEEGPSTKKFLHDNDMKLFVHSPYILNFANRVVVPAEAYWVQSYYDELLIADMIGAEGCIIHVGKYLTQDYQDSLQYMYISLKYLIHRVMDNNLNVKIILETAAGQGTELLATIDNSFEALVTFYQRFSNRERKVLKLCIDTAHVYAAGYDIRDTKLLTNLVETFKDDIVLIHLNDSKREYNSHVDRHERIGKGTIGKKVLSEVVKIAYKYNISIILETPDNGYKKEITWIKSLIDS